MSITFRVATFNAENLFSRPKIFNLKDFTVGDKRLKEIDKLQKLLMKKKYTASDKKKIVSIYKDQKTYIGINENHGKLFKKSGFAITGVKASGIEDWEGAVYLKRAKFKLHSHKNTAKVIRELKADVTAMIEVEDRLTLKKFVTDRLSGKGYRYNMLIDGNDTRGIDVGMISKFEIGGVWTHIFDGTKKSKTFSRDCLEVQVYLPNGQSLWLLINHLKSKGFGDAVKGNARRKSQAAAIRDILKADYDLKKDLVVVAGDLNDTPESDPLKPLISLPNLFDVLAEQFPDKKDRWTYHFKKNEQIDYLLVSKPLKDALVKAHVERRGMWDVDKFTNGAITPWKQITDHGAANAASDHAAVWAEFTL